MNRLNFNQSVGFPLETEILDEMQKAWSILNALGAIAGNFSLISGCETLGDTVSDGVVFINGEVLEFRGGIAGENVIIVIEPQEREFEDTNSREVILVRYATFGTGAVQFPWADFKRGIPTVALQETLNGIASSLETIVTKLNDIEDGAEKNVNADWEATEGDAKILNKPNLVAFLHKDKYTVPDVTGDDLITIAFGDVGTDNYLVVGSLVSKGSNWTHDVDVFWMVRNKTNVSFDLLVKEVQGDGQNLEFNYALIPY